MFSSLQNYVLRGVKLCISFVNILVEGVEGEKQCPFHPLCTMNQRIGYPVEGVEREIPKYIGFIQYWNTKTRSHRVLNRKLYLFFVSLCLCVHQTTIQTDSCWTWKTRRFVHHNSPFSDEENGGLRDGTRRFPTRASTLLWQVINALITLHQCFDDSLRTEWIVNNSNKPLSTPQRAFLRSVKSLFPNHISGSSLNVIFVESRNGLFHPPVQLVICLFRFGFTHPFAGGFLFALLLRFMCKGILCIHHSC